MNKKGNMAFLATFAITFVVAGIYLALGSSITEAMGEQYYWVNNTQTNESLPAVYANVYTNEYAYNATQNVQEGIGSVSGRLPLIGLVVGVVLVIGYLKMVQ